MAIYNEYTKKMRLFDYMKRLQGKGDTAFSNDGISQNTAAKLSNNIGNNWGLAASWLSFIFRSPLC